MRNRPAAVRAVLLALVAPLLVAGPASAPASASGVTYISFEDLPPVCSFISAVPLRGRYAAAKFKGRGPDDGGVVLDTCGAFGVTPRTGSRFLAFGDAALANGGKALGPARIALPVRQKTVSIWVSQAGFNVGSATFTLRGKRAGKVVKTVSTITDTSDWAKLSLTAKKGFDGVVLSAQDPDGFWLADDLTMKN